MRRVPWFVVLQILFIALCLTPVVLHNLEYQTSTPVRQVTVTPISNPPPQVSYTVDNMGLKHRAVNIYDSMQVTESITWVKHIYILGLAADWFESANTYRDIHDMYYALLFFNLAAFILLLGTRRFHVVPHFLNKP